MTSPTAGWYPDPASPANVRWWNGSAWTHNVQPNPTFVAPPSAPTVEPALAAVEVDTLVMERADDETTLVESVAVEPEEVVAPTEIIPDAPEDEGSKERRSFNVDLSDTPKSALVGVASMVLGLVALFLPWMTSTFGSAGPFDASLPWMFSGGDLSAGVSGTIGHGWLYLILIALGAASLSGKMRNQKAGTMAAGGLIVLLTAANYMQFSGSTGDVVASGIGIGIGYGLYLMVVAGIGVLVAGLLTEET